uniref:MICOS complex subunit MIC60 n=1 Tax=Caenorhabditis tropicalis TaxID=1561998 RepID=A0A1I7U938_9PELO
MSMYALPATFPSDFEVHPKIACYRVASYHGEQKEAAPSVQTETDPRKDLEQKQLKLIEQLKKQTEQLKELLSGFGKTAAPAPTQKTVPQETKPAEKSAPKDKDAKKEARKAAKAEAVKKVAGGAAPAPKSAKKTADTPQWTVEDDRKTWETNLTLTVNIPASLVVYKQENLKNVTLTVREADLNWVKALAKIGAKRGVAFDGEVKNQTKEKKTTVKVVKGAVAALQIEKTTVKSLQTIWKTLGAALGLFSRQPEQVLSASHQALWLNKAEQILLGTGDLSYATREASQFLARFDSLSSQWEVSLADVVFRSLLNLQEAHANNVETWAKKIDALIN